MNVVEAEGTKEGKDKDVEYIAKQCKDTRKGRGS